jgi:hypothetical protein
MAEGSWSWLMVQAVSGLWVVVVLLLLLLLLRRI